MADDIAIIRGTSSDIEILVVDINGNRYSLASGEQLVFGIKDKPYKEDAALVKTVDSGTNGIYTVELKPTDTIGLKYGKWFYDVNIKSGDDYFPVFEKPGVLRLYANATKWGDS